jgi:hypothetical protein
MDHAYYGSESAVGSLISRDLFEVAQIRPRIPLNAGFYEVKKNLVEIGRTAGPPQLKVFLV